MTAITDRTTQFTTLIDQSQTAASKPGGITNEAEVVDAVKPPHREGVGLAGTQAVQDVLDLAMMNPEERRTTQEFVVGRNVGSVASPAGEMPGIKPELANALKKWAKEAYNAGTAIGWEERSSLPPFQIGPIPTPWFCDAMGMPQRAEIFANPNDARNYLNVYIHVFESVMMPEKWMSVQSMPADFR